MSCGCNSNPCSCQPRPSVCCAPEQESVLYTFENANLVGIGVFDNETDFLVQYRGLVSLSSSLTLTLNATDNTIEIDFDDAALVADIPDATTTQRGILETATNAEALAKAATDKIVTPSNFAAMGSTTTFAGLVELATEAETIAGVSTTLAVTPAGLAAAGQLTGMTTWADAVTRAGATPSFDGQLGVQLDTDIPFVANGTGVGDFDVPVLISGANSASTDITFALGGNTFEFDGGVISFTGDCSLSIEGVPVASDSLLGQFGGFVGAFELSNFISTANAQGGWGVPSGTLARTTFASYAGQTISNPPTQAEVQAIDDALVIASRRLAALITDLMAVKLPTV